ncbi:MAG: adenosylcobinamide-GDP ribazoletransferase [Candidatus Electrothrix sp. AR4]|nr:adenosylcobinamide-GDP ribazoletransferase [Candidatus Electrothrix sp. AR4]
MKPMNRHRTGNRRRRTPERMRRKSERKLPPLHLNKILLSNLSFFVAALRFLTIIPLPGRFGSGSEELARSVPFFPLIGLLLGCIVVPAAWALHLLAPPPVTAVFLTFLLLSFSGGLHLDGLADTADGFFSARPRERMLEIMRDSATGAMGVIALVLLLALKITCLASMGDKLIFAVFLMPFAGRTAILLLMAMLPYIRPEGGLGSLFAVSFNNHHARTVSLAALLVFSGIAWAASGSQGVLVAFAVLLLTTLFAVFCRQKIGGVTGDTLGAVCELAEAVVALVFALKVGGAV